MKTLIAAIIFIVLGLALETLTTKPAYFALYGFVFACLMGLVFDLMERTND